MESYVQKESGYADAKKNRRVARTALAVFAFGVGDLLLSTLFQDVLYAPLFMDTSFMMAALFAFGPIESFLEYVVFVSLACVKLKLMVGRTDMVFLYALSAITIIAVTWFFVRKKEWLSKGVNQTFLYILAAAMLAGCACSVVSGFISYFTHQLEVKDRPLGSEHWGRCPYAAGHDRRREQLRVCDANSPV